MSVELYPCFLQDEEYSAESLRHVFGTLLARGSAIGSIVGGLVASTDMQVTAGSGMQVLVATGEAWIPGTSVTTQGGYLGRVTSSTALAISAASESNPRIDTIIAQVKDKAVAGGTDSFSVSVVVGTATSGAKLEGGGKPGAGVGSVPASSLVLAYVLVPAKAVSIVSGDIENVATLMVGGTAPPNSSVTDAKVVSGRALMNTESSYTGRTERSKGTEYEPSATKRTLVTLTGKSNGEKWSFELTVNGSVIDAREGPAEMTPYAVCIVEPGEKWGTTSTSGAFKIESYYKSL